MNTLLAIVAVGFLGALAIDTWQAKRKSQIAPVSTDQGRTASELADLKVPSEVKSAVTAIEPGKVYRRINGLLYWLNKENRPCCLNTWGEVWGTPFSDEYWQSRIKLGEFQLAPEYMLNEIDGVLRPVLMPLTTLTAAFDYMTLGQKSDNRVDNIAKTQTQRFYLWKYGAWKDQHIYSEDGRSMTCFDLRHLAARSCESACNSTVSNFLVSVREGKAVPITSKEADVLRKHSKRSLVYLCKSGTWQNNLLVAIRGKCVQYLVLDGIGNRQGMRGFSGVLTPKLLRADLDAGRYVLASPAQAATFWDNSINVYTDEDGSLYAHTCDDVIQFLSAERLTDELKKSRIDYDEFAKRVLQGKYVPASLEKAATFWVALGHFDDEVA